MIFKQALFTPMKKIGLLFIAVSISAACCTPAADSSAQTDTSKQQEAPDSAATKIPVNARLPFGFADLLNYSQPKQWKADAENYGQLKQPDGKAFEAISYYFQTLSKAQTLTTLPDAVEKNYIQIGPVCTDTFYCDNQTQQKTDSLKFRLPDIGNYECYYFFERSKIRDSEYGSLLLLDPKTKKGKTLNIYYRIGGEQSINYRYFYINDNEIKLFEGYCYDDGCSLKECFRVNIDAGGLIKVDEIRQN
jgi:hypothetical protein